MFSPLIMIMPRRRGGMGMRTAPASPAVLDELGDQIVAFTRTHLVDQQGAPMTLAPWQEYVLREIYGAPANPAG